MVCMTTKLKYRAYKKFLSKDVLVKKIVSWIYHNLLPLSLKKVMVGTILRLHDHPSLQFKERLIKAARNGDYKKVDKIIHSDYFFCKNTLEKSKSIELAESFLCYIDTGKEDVNKIIKLAWWTEPEPGNMGDWLSPYVLSKIGKMRISFVDMQSQLDAPHFFCIGSIGKFTQCKSIVLGTGISSMDATLAQDAKYVFVRGPKTRERVIASGGNCPKRYGDPACVMPLLYQPVKKVINNKKLLLVRHFTHRNLTLQLPDSCDETSILMSSPVKIEAFIDKLHEYECVITSAMHCFILCQAYGIPCSMVTFTGAGETVHGDGVKYSDYMLGMDLPIVEVHMLPTDLKDYDFSNIVTNHRISKEKMTEVYSMIENELSISE